MMGLTFAGLSRVGGLITGAQSAMTAPRLREQRRPSPPDRRPPRRGGHPSPCTYAVSTARRTAVLARLRGARRGLARSARMLAATALLALSGALALPATAQAETLLSNTEQSFTPGEGSRVGRYTHAQGFTTGSNALGYRLDSIELHVHTVPTTPSDVTVELWSANSDSEPDASVATLTHSTETWATGANTFNAPTDTELDANTLYFVHVSYSGTGDELILTHTGSTSHDSGEAAGWSVGLVYERTQGSWSFPIRTKRLRFRINGRAFDPLPPTVTSVVVASAPQSGDTYRSYETIVFTVTFSEPVRVTPGRLRLKVGLDNPGGASGSTVEAVFSGLSQSQRPTADTPQARLAPHMHFEYKVQLFDRDDDGVRIGANALRLASGAQITSDGGGNADLDHAAVGTLSDHKVDGRADVPMIRRIEVVSTPRLSSKGTTNRDTYGEGENIRIEVRFDQPVVVEGEPTFALEVGDPCLAVCEARYESGSGTDTLVFAYLVLEVDIDRNGIAIRGNPIEVVSGDSIRNAADQDAHLSSRGKGTQRGHKVDGSRSAASHLSVEDAEAHEADGEMEFTVRLEPHGLGIVTVDYATADGTGDTGAVAGEDYTETRGTLRFNSLDTERTVSVPITDDAHEDDGETFTLTLSNPDGAKLRSGDAKATGTIHNSEIQPLTATFEDVPAAHDGSAFTFRMAFSEDIGISYRALREDALAVTGGRVTRGARVDDRRDLFEMTVRPDGGGDVGIALEARRECAESGAICTKGEPRRKLTNSPSATVAGPGEAPANTPAEGRPAISGTARVGEALTASTAGVSDADGLENAEFAYQWRRGGADIPGADGASYAVVEADEGERLKVRVAFADDAGNAERRTSAATDAVKAAPRANAPAEGAPAISGTARVGGTLTASTSGVTDADGLDNAVFAHQWLRGGADISGATGASYTVVEADLGERLKVRVAFADDAGNEESLTSAATDAVEAAPRANTPAEGRPAISGTARVGGTLTASTSGVTDADGLDNATFAHQWLRGGADIPGATGATYAVVDADEGERLKVRVAFEDDAGNEESLTSAATKAVAARPRPKVSVADARVREAAGATLDFAVTLSAPAPGAVTVGYRTMDASAKAGEDYEARAGKLRFGAGETAKTLRVKVLDDAVDEGDEKMVVVLEPGAGVDRGDRLASGTIENGDPLPAAWLARFGRTAADHAAEAIEERFRDPGGGSHATFGGRRLWGGGGLFDAPAHGGMPGDPFACGPFGGAAPPDRGADPGTNAGIDCGTGAGTPPGMNAGPNGAMGAGMNGGMSAGTNRGLNGELSGGMGTGMDGAPRGPSATGGHRPRLRDLLLGSSFRLSASGADEYGAPRRLTAWGRAAATRFDGVADGVAVDGEVATFLVGADASRNRWLAGITVAHSVGAGAFRGGPGGGAGGLDSTLTAVHPYARWRASERLSAWGALGYGAGDLALETNGSVWETDTSMRMAAGGLRGVFLRGAGGLELAARTDVRLTRIASDGVEDNEAGLLAAAAGGTSRLRLLVEGSRPFRFGETRLLTPTLEIGVRRDGGDAETGAGIDLGGSLRYADAALGLTAEASGRYLVAHEDAAYREWGASASIRIDPGAPGRGLTLSVTPSWGASATGGAERLWSVRDARGLAGHGFDAAMRLRADVGYGLSAFRGMGAATPFLGLSTAGAMGRDWRFGARWTRGAALRMSLEATRREAAGVPPARGIQFGITWRPGARGPSPAAGAYAAGAAGPPGGPDPGAHCFGHGAATPAPAGAPPPDPAAACAPTPTDAGDAGPVALEVVGGSGP